MIQLRSLIEVADNTGGKKILCFGFSGKKRRYAEVGDIITGSVKEVLPQGAVKKGEKVKAVIVRTKAPIFRSNGSSVRFDHNAAVIVDNNGNPLGTRVFGPVARELRDKKFAKVISLAPEVI